MSTEVDASGAIRRAAAGNPILPLLMLAFLDSVGFSIILPVAPSLIVHFTGGASEASVPFGLLLSCYSLALFVSAPIVGRLSDSFGRRPVMLVAMAVVVVDYIVSATAGALWVLFAARLVAGLCGGSTSVISAYMADITPPEDRARRFGLFWAVTALGFIFGPAIGGAVAELGGLRAPFWLAAGLAAVNLVWAILAMPESLRREVRQPLTFKGGAPLVRFDFPPTVKRLLFATLFIQLSRSGLQAVFAVYAQLKLGWSMLEIGGALMAFGGAMIVVQAGLAGKLSARFGERRVLVGGLVLMGVACGLFGFADTGPMVYAAIVLWSLGTVYEPALQGLASRSASASEQGQLQGALTSMNSLGWVFGPTAAAAIFACFTAPGAFVYAPGAAFILAGVLATLAAVVTLEGRVVRPARRVALLEPADR